MDRAGENFALAPRERASLRSRFRERGAAIVEAIIALPILIVVILGAIQFGLVYEAKATLNHASLQAARSGAVSNADPDAIRRGLARGLTPLYSPGSSLQQVASTTARIEAELATDAQVRILNPTREAFADFAEDVSGIREIPNDRLHARSTALGARSGLNIQDANLLRVQVTYGYELKVPLVNWFISRLLLANGGPADPFEQQLLRRMRLPVASTATVRMQSPARESGLVVSRADLPDVERISIDSPSPDASDRGDGRDQDGESGPTQSDPHADGSNLGDGFFGFGSDEPGHGDSENGAADGATDDDPSTPGGDGSGGDDASGDDAPLCTPIERPGEQPDEEQGLLDRIWDELRSIAGEAYDFVRGFWDGIKDQLADLYAAISDPVETARGMYELAVAFIDDPAATARMLGDSLGQDLEQLALCGSYDRGRVVGNYVSPAFMLKLATKLARFGRAELGRSLEETRHELGCASFGAGTPVATVRGLLAIEAVAARGVVQSRSEQSFFDRPQTVTRTFARHAGSYFLVATEGSELEVTGEHPFWVQGRGWVPIEDIELGAPLATVSGDTLLLSKTRIDAPIEVFNLSIQSTPSYFVGSELLWVHNATCTIRVEYRRPRSPSNFQIGASDGGAGQWREITRPDTDAYRYQERITGAPRGVEYNVNGVNFDGYDAERGVLLDAKHWTQECPLGDRCRSESLRQMMADRLTREAQSQIDAVLASDHPDTPIEWRVVDEEMAIRIGAILDQRLPSLYRDKIAIIYTPLTDIVD